MEYRDVLENAKKLMNGNCKVCSVCDGRGCRFTMPGPGCKGPDNVAARNFEAWGKILLNMDNICEKKIVDTSFEFFNQKFALPIIAAPIGAVNIHYSHHFPEIKYEQILLNGGKNINMPVSYWCGFEPHIFKEKLDILTKIDACAIPAIKPFSNEKLKKYMDLAHEYNLPGILMDIDGAGLPMFKENCDDSGNKTVESLKELKSYSKVPFAIKGIMTAKGALKAVEAGFDTIIVSNHGGRVLSCVAATATVLPEIREAVGDKVTVLVDGGIRSGYDVFKAIALGADGVLIARPIPISIIGGGTEGMELYMKKIEFELREAMEMCGAYTLKDISRDMIRYE